MDAYLGIQGLAECEVSLLSLGVKLWWSQLHSKELSSDFKPEGIGEIWPGVFNLCQKTHQLCTRNALYQYPQGVVEEEKSSSLASHPHRPACLSWRALSRDRGTHSSGDVWMCLYVITVSTMMFFHYSSACTPSPIFVPGGSGPAKDSPHENTMTFHGLL